MSIITSKLTNDWYKFTMPPVVRKHYPKVTVGYRFINRNVDFPLARYVDLDRLRDEIEAVKALRFEATEINYLRSLELFDELELQNFVADRLPDVNVERSGDQLVVTTEGPWHSAMAWESPVLAIIGELSSAGWAREAGLTMADIKRVGRANLERVIERLKANPEIRFAQFGLRRHFSNAWEREATARLAREVPKQMIGISNVELAREFGFSLSGTIAHEYFIVPAAIHIGLGTLDPLVVAQNEAMDRWEAEYGGKWEDGLLCAIPDTFGTDFFLRHLTAERAAVWRTFKQDSGNPKVFVDKVLQRLQDLGLDPTHYRINHTDGLNLDKITQLQNYCAGRYKVGFGWGTMLTNNVGVPTHSLVWKPDWVIVGGVKVPCGKLSDNLNKTTGDAAMIERLKLEAGYTNTFSERQSV